MTIGKLFNSVGCITETEFSVEHEPSKIPPNELMQQWADALGEIRDSWVNISLALADLRDGLPTPESDEVMNQVTRHLCRIREAGRRPFD